MRRWQVSTEPSRRPRPPGFISTEVLIAIGVTAVLTLLMSVAILQYTAARRENDTRRILRLAAATEVARIRAGVTAISASSPDSTPTTQPDGTQIAVTTMPGEGLWQGLTRVRVVASQMVLGARRIEVESIAYVAVGGNTP
jgi:hypothetical protein